MTLVVLDGTNLARRAYHAGGHSLVVPTAQRARQLLGPCDVVVAWDSKPPGWRHELWPDYKAHRAADPAAQDFVRDEAKRARAAGLPGCYSPGNEADDVAATLIAAHEGPAAFVSADKDWCQLLDWEARWLVPVRGGLEERDAGWLWDRFGVTPAGWCDFAALAGDASDGIPGAKGIGPVKAARLLAQEGSLDRLLALGRVGPVDAIRVYRRLVELRTDARLYDC